MPKIESSWQTILQAEFEKPYFKKLTDFVESEYKAAEDDNTKPAIYPPKKDIFRAFNCCHFNDIRVVIIGQDPYINEGQANGLCFSVTKGVTLPPSLQNIFKEVSNDMSVPYLEKNNGDLSRWAIQGVLMLNTVLTVQAGVSDSHKGKGWETFTDAVIRAIEEQKKDVIYILWGNKAQKHVNNKKGALRDVNKKRILTAAHPSPLSIRHGFFGCKHFSKVNKYLEDMGEKPIVW